MSFDLLCISTFEQGQLEPWRYRNAFIIIVIIIIIVVIVTPVSDVANVFTYFDTCNSVCLKCIWFLGSCHSLVVNVSEAKPYGC